MDSQYLHSPLKTLLTPLIRPNPFKPAQLRIVNFVGSNASTPSNNQESIDSRQKKLYQKTFPFIPSKRLSDNGLQSPNQYVVKIGAQSHNISAISPLPLSDVNSPINFNLLAGKHIHFL